MKCLFFGNIKLLSFETKGPLHISAFANSHLVEAQLIAKKIDFLSVICLQRVYSLLQKFRSLIAFFKMGIGVDIYDADNKV